MVEIFCLYSRTRASGPRDIRLDAGLQKSGSRTTVVIARACAAIYDLGSLGDVGGLWAFLSLRNLEFNLIALLKAFVTF